LYLGLCVGFASLCLGFEFVGLLCSWFILMDSVCVWEYVYRNMGWFVGLCSWFILMVLVCVWEYDVHKIMGLFVGLCSWFILMGLVACGNMFARIWVGSWVCVHGLY
jgi:hypothetical protein